MKLAFYTSEGCCCTFSIIYSYLIIIFIVSYSFGFSFKSLLTTSIDNHCAAINKSRLSTRQSYLVTACFIFMSCSNCCLQVSDRNMSHSLVYKVSTRSGLNPMLNFGAETGCSQLECYAKNLFRLLSGGERKTNQLCLNNFIISVFWLLSFFIFLICFLKIFTSDRHLTSNKNSSNILHVLQVCSPLKMWQNEQCGAQYLQQKNNFIITQHDK